MRERHARECEVRTRTHVRRVLDRTPFPLANRTLVVPSTTPIRMRAPTNPGRDARMIRSSVFTLSRAPALMRDSANLVRISMKRSRAEGGEVAFFDGPVVEGIKGIESDYIVPLEDETLR